jgi:hypothetical protein
MSSFHTKKALKFNVIFVECLLKVCQCLALSSLGKSLVAGADVHLLNWNTTCFPKIERKERLIANISACLYCHHACFEFPDFLEDFRRESRIKYPQV